MDNDNKEAKNLFTLSLPDVASWQVDGIESPLSAALPALQRGAVWKPAQTERLWDSLMRGFPIGSFLLSEYDADHYWMANNEPLLLPWASMMYGSRSLSVNV